MPHNIWVEQTVRELRSAPPRQNRLPESSLSPFLLAAHSLASAENGTDRKVRRFTFLLAYWP